MAEPRIVVLPDAPQFTVVRANKAYKIATGISNQPLEGQSLWELFKADIASTNARAVFEGGLNDVIRHRSEAKLPIFRFDGGSKPRWWQVEISPVLDESGELVYLVCTTRNMTLHVEDQAAILKGERENAALLIRQQEQSDEADRSGDRNRELTDSEYLLNRIVEATPSGLAIIKGGALAIEKVNDAILKLWGRKKEAVLGQELLKVFPELKDQPFISYLNEVFYSGKTVKLDRQPGVIVLPGGEIKDVFVDFSYDPLFDKGHRVDSVLVTVTDITAIVHAQQLLQDREEELEVMNEELTATNEELKSINEELRRIKEEE